MRTDDQLVDQVGPVIEPFVGGVAVEGGAVFVGHRVGEVIFVQMRWDQVEAVDGVIIEGQLAVAPVGFGANGVGDGDAALAVGRAFRHRQAVFDCRQLDAQHAPELPVLVVDGQWPPGQAEDIGLGQHGVDVGVES